MDVFFEWNIKMATLIVAVGISMICVIDWGVFFFIFLNIFAIFWKNYENFQNGYTDDTINESVCSSTNWNFEVVLHLYHYFLIICLVIRSFEKKLFI